MAVEEIKKKVYEPCPHVVDTGCGCYETRPESCRTFYCFYQAGILEGDERRRPDQLGLMFISPKESSIAVDCWEVWPGAADDPKAVYLLASIAQRLVVYVRFMNGKRRVMGPEHLVRSLGTIREVEK